MSIRAMLGFDLVWFGRSSGELFEVLGVYQCGASTRVGESLVSLCFWNDVEDERPSSTWCFLMFLLTFCLRNLGWMWNNVHHIASCLKDKNCLPPQVQLELSHWPPCVLKLKDRNCNDFNIHIELYILFSFFFQAILVWICLGTDV